jgi:5-methylthioadenosine/S-adenosylhomocysteine deaminase
MKQQVDKIIFNGYLVTVDEKALIIENGALAVTGKQITSLGESNSILDNYQAEEMIDVAGGIILPGLIDTHTHLATVLLRGLAEDIPLEPWLQKVWLAEKAVMTAENVEVASQLGISELVLGGTTCAVDMYWFPEATARAARQVGFRLVNGPAFLEMDNPPDGLSFTDRLAFTRDYVAQYRDNALIHPMLMPHSTYTDSPLALQKIKVVADELNVMLHIHTAETAGEVQDVQARHGLTPIRLLHSLGLLDERILLAHCVYISPDEIELIAKMGASVAHNPISNMKLASGVAPIAQMMTHKVKLSIGTDGAQSGNDLDMWWSIRLASLLQKGFHRDATLMKAQDMIRMATIEAARCIGLGDVIGSLEPGKIADVIVLRRNAAHLTPMYDIYAHLVYAYGREDVEAVMINGDWVMRERRLLHTDLDANMEKVNSLAQKVARII